MKKLLKIMFTFLIEVMMIFAFVFTGCNSNKSTTKYNVVCTIFPEYDWVKQIVGEDNTEVGIKLLLDNGADLHSYQPTFDDEAQISTCDLFIYVGGESDVWVPKVLKSAKNKQMKVINLLEVLDGEIDEEEVKEGMEEEEEEPSEGEEEEPEYDEHVWLSLRKAKKICKEITKNLKEKDSKNAETYDNNLTTYSAKLDALDEEYTTAVNDATYDTLVFADRFPFHYFVKDYNIDYYAAFVGCSAATKASFETTIFLAGKIDALGLKTIMKIEGPNMDIANSVKQNATTGSELTIRTIDSMQSTTATEIKAGKTYLSTMTDNLEVLKLALN